METLNEKIVKKVIDGKPHWVVVSHTGKNLGKYPYTTEGKHQAHIRLGQVDVFKAKSAKNESNITKFKELLESKLVTIEKSQGEYRVPSEDGYEDGAYYTNDRDDAIGVAKKVFGADIDIKYRSVPEFVGGKYEKMRPKNMKESESHKEQIEGYEDYHDGKKKKDNPYDKDSEFFNAWLEGWEQAEEDSNTELGKGMKTEALAKAKGLCKQCGIKLSKLSKDEGFCTECATPIKESLDEAKTPEEQEAFNKAEKEVADKMGLTLPLPKDTSRDDRNKLYAQVATKLKKKSNVGKVLDKLGEGYHDDKVVKHIIMAQKALGNETYSTTEIGYMSQKEQKDYLDTLESKIEKQGIKGYTFKHLS